MHKKFKIVKIDSEYYDFLRKSDSKVPYNADKLPNNVRNRCCAFSQLEEKCNEYNQSDIYIY